MRGPPLLGSRPEVRGFLGQTRKLRQKRSSPTIDSAWVWPYNSIASWGAVAQLGERVNGIHEVVGSIPISSTKIFFILFNKVQDVHDIKHFLPTNGSLWSKKIY